MATPVVIKGSQEGARPHIRVLGTDKQFRQIDANLKRKGKMVAFTRADQPGAGRIDAFCEIDFAALSRGDALVAVAKYAANYALYSIRLTELTLALAEQAHAALEGRVDPTSFAGFLADADILNRMRSLPPHHTVMLAPIGESQLSRRRWGVTVILFGMLPYYVLSP